MNFSQRLNKVIPGGAHTYSRGDDQYPDNAPQILSRGEGAYVFAPDGTRLLDYGMALRAITVGYAYPSIAEAAIREIWKGNNLTRASETELEAAELLVSLIDGADMVKFAKNGSTVTTAAVKIARAFTNRPLIAVCGDHPFFSYDDWFIGSTVVDRGIPETIKKMTLKFRYNDIASLNALFAEHDGQIAAVIMEPATTEGPRDGFLHKVKETCHNNGAIFILDEMITGFRFHLQGAQKYFNVIPDMCCFGKGMANGFSVAALAGKRELMELGGIQKEGAERLFLISTTHGAEMCGLGAFIETVKVYREMDVIGKIWSFGQKLMDGLNGISAELGISNHFKVTGFPCLMNYLTNDNDGNPSLTFRTLFMQEMLKKSVLIPWMAHSFSHGDRELEITLDAARSSLRIYRQALETTPERFLNSRIIKPVFRKFN